MEELKTELASKSEKELEDLKVKEKWDLKSKFDEWTKAKQGELDEKIKTVE